MDDKLKSYLNSIYSMAKNKFNSKSQYRYTLNCLQEYVTIEKKDSAILDSLNGYMENLHNRVNAVDSSSLSQFPFWVDYVKWNIWHHFRDNGIGHLSSFTLSNNHITCTIHLDMHISKDFNEDEETFTFRKNQFNDFIKNNNLQLNDSMLINNDHNNKFIVNYINSYVDGRLFKTETIKGCIYSITFSFSANSKFLFKKHSNFQNKKENTDILSNVDLEKIEHNIKEWFNTITLCEEMNEIDNKKKLDKTASQLVATLYVNTCEIVGLENDTTKEYKNLNQTNKERNWEARRKEEEIGSQYDLSEMFNISSNVYSNISEYLYHKYCFYLKELNFNEYPTIVVSFDTYQYYTNYEGYSSEKDSINLDELNSILDIIYNSDCGDATLELNAKNQKTFEEVISKDLCCEISNLEINYKKGKPIIQSATYHILDLEKFLKKFEKREE